MAEPNPNPPRITEQDKLRFWSGVNQTEGCWLWTRAHGRDGYGLFQVYGPKRMLKAHRFAWLVTRGEWPSLNVLHHCDVRDCVRPDHLWLGTDADNIADRDRKGRQNNGRAKLTSQAARYIREQYPHSSSPRLAAQFGVSRGTIWRCVKGISRYR